jgi:cyclopropane fatty-acyl-phospholipid synthase-like methyltransferase
MSGLRGAAGSTRELHRDSAGREGMEAELVSRLTEGIAPDGVRRVLVRCLDGALSPQVALMQLLVATDSLTEVRFVVDEITQRADADSRAGDSLVRDRVDELTRLFVENEAGCALVAGMLQHELRTSAPAATVEEGIAYCERLFDWRVKQSEEASVALYSLGSPEILERATAEVVALLDGWGVLGASQRVLQIGCGIGRFERALAGRVAEAHGVDVSGEMVKVARRRCAGLPSVRITRTDGRDLALYGDAEFDLVYAVDTWPYVVRSGEPLVESYVREARRVLRPGGTFAIFNYSDRGEPAHDEADLRRYAERSGFEVLVAGERPFVLWDGAVYRLVAGRGAA